MAQKRKYSDFDGCSYRQEESSSELCKAIASGCTEDAISMLYGGKNPYERDRKKRTPLHWAAWTGDSVSISLLISLGTDTNARDADGLTPMHCAASNNAEAIRILHENGCPLESEDDWGRRPIHYAIASAALESLDVLLDLGASASAKDARERSALGYASYHLDSDMAIALAKAGADLNELDDVGFSALHVGVWETIDKKTAALEFIEALLKNGADPNVKDSLGEPPLMLAVEMVEEDVATILLNAGADVNAVGKNGATALEKILEKEAKALGKRRDSSRRIAADMVGRGAEVRKGEFKHPLSDWGKVCAEKAKMSQKLALKTEEKKHFKI